MGKKVLIPDRNKRDLSPPSKRVGEDTRAPCPSRPSAVGAVIVRATARFLAPTPQTLGARGPVFPGALGRSPSPPRRAAGVGSCQLLGAAAKGLLGLLVAVTVVGHHAQGRAWGAGLWLELGAEFMVLFPAGPADTGRLWGDHFDHSGVSCWTS